MEYDNNNDKQPQDAAPACYCIDCGSVFPTNDDLIEHYWEEHPESIQK